MRLTRGLFAAFAVAVCAGAVASDAPPARADSGPAFFPTPPPGVRLRVFKGVLVDYAIGMKAGTIVVRRTDGSKVLFLAGKTMSINGKTVVCLAPPANGQSPPPELCPDWPAAVKIGTSSVTVYYWDAPFEGVSRPVTGQLTSP
jgi:hypothetical protein